MQSMHATLIATDSTLELHNSASFIYVCCRFICLFIGARAGRAFLRREDGKVQAGENGDRGINGDDLKQWVQRQPGGNTGVGERRRRSCLGLRSMSADAITPSCDSDVLNNECAHGLVCLLILSRCHILTCV